MNYLIKNTKEYNEIKNEILNKLGVQKTEFFDSKLEIRKRIDYLKAYLKETNTKGYVLGISGGVDSTTVGRLCQIAVEELRKEGFSSSFIAVRLPAGIQKDEQDAQKALNFIKPDKIKKINIGETANLLNEQVLLESKELPLSEFEKDFTKGNTKARLRMVAQYHLAALNNCLVIGTDHNSEACMGFYTKYGDGACDLIVLDGLNKRQVRLLSKELGSPEELYLKSPTADLEELNEGKLDDEGFGFPYYKLDDFLEGKDIDDETEGKIINQYFKTQHKRKPIVSFK